jgi:hypothetical protein
MTNSLCANFVLRFLVLYAEEGLEPITSLPALLR